MSVNSEPSNLIDLMRGFENKQICWADWWYVWG